MTTIPPEVLAGRFGAPFDGVADDGPGIQLAIDYLEARNGGIIELPRDGTPVTLATGLTFTANATVILDAYGTEVSYTGAGACLTFTYAGVAAGARRNTVRGGTWSGPTATQFALMTDTGDTKFIDLALIDWDNANLFEMVNDIAWCENNSFINIKAVRFTMFMLMRRTVASTFGSFARTRVVNGFAADGGQSLNWVRAETGTGPYDSLFELHGNCGANIDSLFYCGGAWGNTEIAVRVEQNIVPAIRPAAHFDASATTGGSPYIRSLTNHNSMTVMKPGQNLDWLTSRKRPQGLGVVDDNYTNVHQITPTGLYFFGDQLPVVQQSATSLATLWTALENYGLLDAGSAAPAVGSVSTTGTFTADGIVTTFNLPHLLNTPAPSLSFYDTATNEVFGPGEPAQTRVDDNNTSIVFTPAPVNDIGWRAV